jgi:hypothetical protein
MWRTPARRGALRGISQWKVVCMAPRERISIVAEEPDNAQDQVTAPLP